MNGAEFHAKGIGAIHPLPHLPGEIPIPRWGYGGSGDAMRSIGLYPTDISNYFFMNRVARRLLRDVAGKPRWTPGTGKLSQG